MFILQHLTQQVGMDESDIVVERRRKKKEEDVLREDTQLDLGLTWLQFCPRDDEKVYISNRSASPLFVGPSGLPFPCYLGRSVCSRTNCSLMNFPNLGLLILSQVPVKKVWGASLLPSSR
jgi:hypothetical protein